MMKLIYIGLGIAALFLLLMLTQIILSFMLIRKLKNCSSEEKITEERVERVDRPRPHTPIKRSDTPPVLEDIPKEMTLRRRRRLAA